MLFRSGCTVLIKEKLDLELLIHSSLNEIYVHIHTGKLMNNFSFSFFFPNCSLININNNTFKTILADNIHSSHNKNHMLLLSLTGHPVLHS